MNKKGIGRALTLLLSIAIITLEITVFYSAYGAISKPVTFAIQEVPGEIDDNLLLLNLLRTETEEGTIADEIIKFYLIENNDYTLKKHITIFVEKFYGEDYIWKISVNDDKITSNYNVWLIVPINVCNLWKN